VHGIDQPGLFGIGGAFGSMTRAFTLCLAIHLLISKEIMAPVKPTKAEKISN